MKIRFIKNGLIYDFIEGELKEVDKTIFKPLLEFYIYINRNKKYVSYFKINTLELKAKYLKENSMYIIVYNMAKGIERKYNIELTYEEIKILKQTKNISIFKI